MNKIRLRYSGLLGRSLNFIEKAGNSLPHPATLFLILALIALISSWLALSSSVSPDRSVLWFA